MSFLSQIFGTIVGFCAVMLTVSLVVMALVRIVQYLHRQRGRTLGEMLGSLNVGFRLANGDTAKPGDDAQTAFVIDVLSYPTLHSPAAMQSHLAKATETRHLTRGMEDLAHGVEYISMGDLILIVRRLAAIEQGADTTPGARSAFGLTDEIPARWHRDLPPANRKLDVFIDYVRTWFQTVEAASSERFKEATRRLTLTISCIIVVLVNIDSLALVSNLYRSGAVRDDLANRAPQLLAAADRVGASQPNAPVAVERDELLHGVSDDLVQLNAVLNLPDLEFGWEHSWISKDWCAHYGQCVADDNLNRKSLGQWLVDLLRWLVGLTVSCLMLSMGAPFWADQLRNALNFRNSVQLAKTTPTSGSPQGDDEDPADDPGEWRKFGGKPR